MNPFCCDVLELRQYTTRPGYRDKLVEIFDRLFIESQEDLGVTVVGQFRDRQRPDRFVWLRGFLSMESRRASLEQFYNGPVWAEHRDETNETMTEFHDVLLLKPARPDWAFRLNLSDRPAPGEEKSSSIVFAGIYSLDQPVDSETISRFEREGIPGLRASGIHVDGIFVTEAAANTYPRLPLREGENVLVWFGTLEHGELLKPLADPPTVLLELEPTPRSLLGRHRTERQA